jgi:hypothetical protein
VRITRNEVNEGAVQQVKGGLLGGLAEAAEDD